MFAVSKYVQALNMAGMEEGKDAADRKDKSRPQDEQHQLIDVKPSSMPRMSSMRNESKLPDRKIDWNKALPV